jgi:hypothetical protein
MRTTRQIDRQSRQGYSYVNFHFNDTVKTRIKVLHYNVAYKYITVAILHVITQSKIYL